MPHLLYLHTYCLLDHSLINCNRFCISWHLGFSVLVFSLFSLVSLIFLDNIVSFAYFLLKRFVVLITRSFLSLSSKLVVFRRHHLTSGGARPRNFVCLLLLRLLQSLLCRDAESKHQRQKAVKGPSHADFLWCTALFLLLEEWQSSLGDSSNNWQYFPFKSSRERKYWKPQGKMWYILTLSFCKGNCTETP